MSESFQMPIFTPQKDPNLQASKFIRAAADYS